MSSKLTRSYMRLEEDQLIRQAQRGDMAAFEQLIRRYERQVLNIALRYSGNPDTAQDVFQDVFLRVHGALKSFKAESSFSTWLYRITANACLSRQSSERRRRYVSLDQESWLADSAEFSSAGTSHSVPEVETYRGEISQRIRDAVGRLSPQQRIVFVLRHFEGHKLREIASMLDCAEGTVKKHLFTAVQRLRSELNEIRG